MFERSSGYLAMALVVLALGIFPPWTSSDPGWITVGGVAFAPLWSPPGVVAAVDTGLLLIEWVVVGAAGWLLTAVLGK